MAQAPAVRGLRSRTRTQGADNPGESPSGFPLPFTAWPRDPRGRHRRPEQRRGAVGCEQSGGKHQRAENEFQFHVAVPVRRRGMLRGRERLAGIIPAPSSEQHSPELPEDTALPAPPAAPRKMKSLPWGNPPGIVPVQGERGKQCSPAFRSLFSPSVFAFMREHRLKFYGKDVTETLLRCARKTGQIPINYL